MPPTPPAVLDVCNTSEGKLCRPFCLQMAVLRPPLHATSKKYDAITKFAVRESCAAYLVRA